MQYTLKGVALVGGAIVAGLYVWAFYVKTAVMTPQLTLLGPLSQP